MNKMKKLILISVFLGSEVFAGGRDLINAPILNQTYIKECGSCHMAYPGELMTKSNWNNLLNNLSKHYGNDASIGNNELNSIRNYVNSTNTYRKSSNTSDYRITSDYWFQRKHANRININKKSLSNCSECHTPSGNGIGDENEND